MMVSQVSISILVGILCLLQLVVAGPYTITDFNPKTIGLLGESVTVTGKGFIVKTGTVLCSGISATTGTNYNAIVLSNTTLICPLRKSSVGTGTATTRTSSIYVWLSGSQSTTTATSTATITQNDGLVPVISNVYIQPSGGAARRNYINTCNDTSASATLVIEGSYLGIAVADINYLAIGLPPSAAFVTISPSTGFVSINSTRVVARLPTISGIPNFVATNVYYGYNGTGTAAHTQLSSSSSGQINTKGCFRITSFTPTSLSQIGALVTIVGSGFSWYNNIQCAAQSGSTTGRPVTVINDFTLICPIGLGAVGYGYTTGQPYRADYITLWQSGAQSSTIIASPTQIGQDDYVKPYISNAYILWARNYDWTTGDERYYVSSCDANEEQYLVLEGTNLGFELATMLNFWIASEFPGPDTSIIPYVSLDASNVVAYSQTQIVVQLYEPDEYSDFPASLVYYNWGIVGVGGDYTQYPDPDQPYSGFTEIRGCVEDEPDAPGICSPVTC
jgi:hypothetical protein